MLTSDGHYTDIKKPEVRDLLELVEENGEKYWVCPFFKSLFSF